MSITRPENLLDLPPEMRLKIYSNLSNKTMGFLLFTSKTTHEDIKNFPLSNFKPHLLRATAWAFPDKIWESNRTKLAIEDILHLYPQLLFEEGVTTLPEGGQIFGSPYRIAWSMGDVWMIKFMNNKIIPRIDNGIAIAKAQYQEQFPDGKRYDARNRKQIEQIKKDIVDISLAISQDPCTEPTVQHASLQNTLDIINKFKTNYAPKTEVIKTGTYSPPEIFKIIYAAYLLCAPRWTYPQRVCFGRHIIQYAARIAAPVDAQRYTKGFINDSINEETTPDRVCCYFYDAQFRCHLDYLDPIIFYNTQLIDIWSVLIKDAAKKNYPALLCDAKEIELNKLTPEVLEEELQKKKMPGIKY